MAKGFRCGPGGGTLAIRITAYATQNAMDAATPPEQTFGIITDQAITGWSCSPERPETDKIGYLWIQTGSSSTGSVNALAYNEIKICPLSAEQRTENGWVVRTGKTFAGGNWKPWGPEVAYLFTAGNQHVDLTGGWNGIDLSAQTLSLAVDKQATGTGVGGYVSTVTAKKIDISNYGAISATVDACDKLFTLSVRDDSDNVVAKVTGTIGVITLDISDITGSYYVKLEADGSYYNGRSTARFDVSEVALLKQDLRNSLNILGVTV